MSFIERSTAYPVAGVPAWRPCAAPVWRGGWPCPVPLAAAVWWHPEACLSLDFKADRFMCGGAEVAADAVFAVTRSSHTRLPDGSGALQSLGNDALPRTDRGVYANGQITALNANGNNPQSATGWSNQGAVTLVNGPAEGIFSTLYVSGSGTVRRQTAIITLAGAVTLAVKVSYGPGANPSANAVVVLVTPGSNWVFSGAPGALVAIQTGGGSVTIVRNDAGEFWFLHTTAGAGDVRVGLGSGDAAKDIKLRGIDITQTGFVPDAWVSDASPAPALLASDIRAAQGARPSNGEPEPFPGWEGAGLDDGVTVLLDFENRFRGAGSRRLFSLTKKNTATDIAVDVGSAGNTFRLTAGGATNGIPGGQTGARSRVAARVLPDGSYAMTQKGQASVSTGTTPSAISLDSSAVIGIGNRPALDQPWNDWVYELQVCRPLSDAQLLEWVNT